mmetsp:Transcript_147931/g.473562  ORF Transcript_147931/g.473562 Transcript_147931/m.473562 type:complete len:382 (+) Transcript_147931:1634-2779(+)
MTPDMVLECQGCDPIRYRGRHLTQLHGNSDIEIASQRIQLHLVPVDGLVEGGPATALAMRIFQADDVFPHHLLCTQQVQVYGGLLADKLVLYFAVRVRTILWIVDQFVPGHPLKKPGDNHGCAITVLVIELQLPIEPRAVQQMFARRAHPHRPQPETPHGPVPALGVVARGAPPRLEFAAAAGQGDGLEAPGRGLGDPEVHLKDAAVLQACQVLVPLALIQGRGQRKVRPRHTRDAPGVCGALAVARCGSFAHCRSRRIPPRALSHCRSRRMLHRAVDHRRRRMFRRAVGFGAQAEQQQQQQQPEPVEHESSAQGRAATQLALQVAIAQYRLLMMKEVVPHQTSPLMTHASLELCLPTELDFENIPRRCRDRATSRVMQWS